MQDRFLSGQAMMSFSMISVQILELGMTSVLLTFEEDSSVDVFQERKGHIRVCLDGGSS